MCVRDGLAASVCVYSTPHTSTDSFELRPREGRTVAFPRWVRVQNCSMWLILIVPCCFGGLSVRDGLALLFAYVALLLLPLTFFLGVGAPSLSLGGFMFKAARRGSMFVVAAAAYVLASLALLVIIII